MKKTLNTLLLLCFTMAGFAQAPQGIPYQTVLRHANGSLILNQNVALRFSIHDSVANGTVLYQETQMSPTNGLELVTVTIGQGTAVGAAFTGINWGHNNKFLQI